MSLFHLLASNQWSGNVDVVIHQVGPNWLGITPCGQLAGDVVAVSDDFSEVTCRACRRVVLALRREELEVYRLESEGPDLEGDWHPEVAPLVALIPGQLVMRDG